MSAEETDAKLSATPEAEVVEEKSSVNSVVNSEAEDAEDKQDVSDVEKVDEEEEEAPHKDGEASDLSDLEDVDEDVELKYLEEQDAFKLGSHKRSSSKSLEDQPGKKKEAVRQRKRRADDELEDNREITYSNESEAQKRRRELEERLDASIKNKTTRRKKKDEDDLEMFQDAAISLLKERMKIAAEMDKESVLNGEPALEKLKLLPEVRNVLLRLNLADSILDNNLLESVRIWLEPLPGLSLPAYEIQKTLFQLIVTLPIKTIHLQESGLGKIMLFYQRSKKIEPSIKRTADKLIGDWTRPIMKRSDNYRDKTVQSALFDYHKFKHTPAQQSRVPEQKTLYEEAAARRKRALAPLARTSLYKVAPKVNPDIFNQRSSRELLGIQSSLKDERFKSLSKKLNSMSSKKKAAGKGGISIEGKELGT